MKCFEHFCEPSPNELAAFKLVAKFLQESNLKGIGIFMSNITVITLNKFGKRARGLLRTRISSFILIWMFPCLVGLIAFAGLGNVKRIHVSAQLDQFFHLKSFIHFKPEKCRNSTYENTPRCCDNFQSDMRY